jgi:radical SAM-linked protein
VSGGFPTIVLRRRGPRSIVPPFRQKLRLRFAKRGDLRFISHHDVMRLWERACRRAGLPLKMSEGFNPRPRLSFPLSLAVGVEGREEVVEVQLSEWLAPAEVERRLKGALPAGMTLGPLGAVDPQRKGAVAAVTCTVEHQAVGRLTAGDLEALLARREVLVDRAHPGADARRVNVRPYLSRLSLRPRGTTPAAAAPSAPVLAMDLKVTPAGTARPDEVLAALGAAPGPDEPAPRVVRERVRLTDE